MAQPALFPTPLAPPEAPKAKARARPKPYKAQLRPLLGKGWYVAANTDHKPCAGLFIGWNDFAYVFDARLEPTGWSLWDGRGDTIGHSLTLEQVAAALLAFVPQDGPTMTAAALSSIDFGSIAKEPTQ